MEFGHKFVMDVFLSWFESSMSQSTNYMDTVIGLQGLGMTSVSPIHS
jgi:hypothetical protein